METIFVAAVEPEHWNVVFHRKAASRWMGLVAMGHFKHVSAFAYLVGIKGWVLYDVQLWRTRIVVMPDNDEARSILAQIIHGNDVITMERRPQTDAVGWRPRLFCTGAVRHLLGLSGSALRPDALRRHCLRHGGVAIPDEAPLIAARPDAGARASAG